MYSDINNQAKMGLYYCKDIFAVDTGRRIVRAILDVFPDAPLEFYDSSRDLLLKRDISEKELKRYLRSEWNRLAQIDSHFGQINTGDKTFNLNITRPRHGQSRLLPPNRGNVKFHTGDIGLFSRMPGRNYTHEIQIAECLSRLSQIVEASYGNVRLSGQTAPWRLDSFLNGVFWVTLFGPDYVEMIGKSRFDRLPCHKTQWLSDGSALLILTPTMEEAVSPRGFALAEEIKLRIGEIWFRPRHDDPGWYPRLRNLLPREDVGE